MLLLSSCRLLAHFFAGDKLRFWAWFCLALIGISLPARVFLILLLILLSFYNGIESFPEKFHLSVANFTWHFLCSMTWDRSILGYSLVDYNVRRLILACKFWLVVLGHTICHFVVALYNRVDRLVLIYHLAWLAPHRLLCLLYLLVVVVLLFLYDFREISHPVAFILLWLRVKSEGSLHSKEDENMSPHAFPINFQHRIIRDDFYNVSELDQLWILAVFVISVDLE